MNTPDRVSRRQRSSRWLSVFVFILGLMSAVSLGAMVLAALAKVSNGSGLETYRTFWLVEFNWVGFLVLAACAIIALLGALLIRSVQVRRELNEFKELEQLGAKGERGA